MVVGGVSSALDVPVFDAPHDVAGVRRPQHQFDLVPPVQLIVMEQQIQPACLRLDLLGRHELNIAQTQKRLIFGDPVLNPLLRKLRVRFQIDAFRLGNAAHEAQEAENGVDHVRIRDGKIGGDAVATPSGRWSARSFSCP